MSTASLDCDDFFEATALPENFQGKKQSIETFVERHKGSKQPVVLVTVSILTKHRRFSEVLCLAAYGKIVQGK